MTPIALILAAVLALQDDFPQWISRLASDSLVEREEATTRLRSLGEAGLERLGKARDAAADAEVRARIDAIIVGIKKAAEFAKVFGPTKRVTIAARGVPLKEVLSQLAAPGVSAIEPGALDGESRIDFQIRHGTWWEALDGVVRAAGGRYRLEYANDHRVRVVLVRGKAPEFPVMYSEQFRISVSEVVRVEHRGSGEVDEAAFAVVELRWQPGLKPNRNHFDRGLTIDAVLDAKGVDAKQEPPAWDDRSHMSGDLLMVQGMACIRKDAAAPLTLTGSTAVSFPHDVRDVSLALEGDARRTQIGATVVRVLKFSATEVGTSVTLRMEGAEDPDRLNRVPRESVVVVDGKGERHPGTLRSTSYGGETTTLEFEFTSGIPEPKQLAFRWVAEFHKVELPFRLEGIKLPEFKPASK
jgi:hypothetical protein